MIRTYACLLAPAFLLLGGGCGHQSGQGAVREGLEAFREHNFEKAAAQFSRAAKRITDSPELYYNLGRAYQELGQMEPAREALEAALELRPGYADALTSLGQVAYHQNDLPLAAQSLERALEGTDSATERARILNSLSLVQTGLERPDLARLCLLRALKADRRYAPAHYNLATCYRDVFNLHEEALDHFEIFVRLVSAKDPHYEKASVNIKRLRLVIERARTDEMERIRRDPATAARHLQEGVRLQIDKQYPRAIRAYREALAADPLTFSAAFGLALSHRVLGQRAEAVEAFKRAAEISPGHQDSYYQAADLALQLRQTAEAAKILDRAIARSPLNPANAELMARIRYAETRLPEARAYGEYYLSLLPEGDKNRAPYEAWVKSLPVR